MGKVQKRRVCPSLRQSPGGDIRLPGFIADFLLAERQHRVRTGRDGERPGGDLGDPLLAFPVLAVEVPAEKEADPILPEEVCQPRGAAHHIARGEHRLPQEVLVPGGEDALPGSLRLGKLFPDPDKGHVRDAAGVVEGIEVQHQKAGRLRELYHIAQGVGVCAERLVKAEIGVDTPEILRPGGGDKAVFIAGEGGGAGIVQIVVARQDIDRDPVFLQIPQLFRKRRMTEQRPVEGEVPGEDQGRGPLGNDLAQEGVRQLFDIAHELPVAALGKRSEERAVIGQGGGQIVEVGRNDQGVGRLRVLRPGSAAEQQRQQAHKQRGFFHSSPLPLFL